MEIAQPVPKERGEGKGAREDVRVARHFLPGMFGRSFTLPAEAGAAKVEAAFDKGVLEVTIPKLPEAQSKAQKMTVKPQG
jgi:HSP20 family protein